MNRLRSTHVERNAPPVLIHTHLICAQSRSRSTLVDRIVFLKCSKLFSLCVHMRSRPTPVDPNAIPMCSDALSLVKPFSSSDTATRNHVKFDQIRIDRTPVQPGSGSGHFRAQIHRAGTMSDLINFVSSGRLFCSGLAEAIFEIIYDNSPHAMRHSAGLELLASIASI